MATDVLVNPERLIDVLDECRESLRNLAHSREQVSIAWATTHAVRSAAKAARAIVKASDHHIGQWGDLPHILRWHRDPNREPAHIRTESADGRVWEAEIAEIKIGSGFNPDGSLPDDTALVFWVQFLCPFLRSYTGVLSSNAGAFDFLDRSNDDAADAVERIRAQAADWADCCRVAVELVQADEGTADGPVDGFRWRHNGEVIQVDMQPAAWKLANYLWHRVNQAASFDELLVPIYDDPEHIADANAFGSLRRAVNKYFETYGIPFRVGIKKTIVTLTAAE